MPTELYIDTDRAARDLVDRMDGESAFALDTEFVRERTYYPELCLIQIASDSVVACIDCLAGLNLERLLEALFRPDRACILHSARQDLEVIYRFCERLPNELRDTQIAAGLAGFSPQIGLQDLLADVLDINLEKGYARTDWGRRPLPPAALRYALDDVRYLPLLWRALTDKLGRLERLDWLMEDCRVLLETPPYLEEAILWTRLKGLGALEKEAQCAAFELIRWREKLAQALNRPRRWIMGDDLLIAIARRMPGSLDELRSIAEIPPRLIERSGKGILAALRRRSDPQVRAMVETRSARERPDKAQFKRLQEGVKERASELGIHPELLATRREILDSMRGTHSQRIAGGWRRQELERLTRNLRSG